MNIKIGNKIQAKHGILIGTVLSCFLVFSNIWATEFIVPTADPNHQETIVLDPNPSTSIQQRNSADISSLTLYANDSLVMDAESGNVLVEKNGYNKVYPASTTKILTAILALEHLDLNKSVVVSKNAVYSTPAGSSIIALQPGEVMTVKNLIYGLLIHSGNDAANVLAEEVSGSTEAFIELMNQTLKEIGCDDTHFTNAHGFHDPDHYTTPYDMAKLMRYAMQNDTFREIVETKKYTIPATNKSEERIYPNTNKMLNENYTKMYYPYTLGGKTGYTEEARGTYVGYAKKDDKLVIVSVFDGSQNIARNEARFLDAITLCNYTFDHFEKQKVADKNNLTFQILDKETRKIYTVGLSQDEYALLPDDASTYARTYQLDLDFNALHRDDKTTDSKVGTITIEFSGKDIQAKNTYALNYIEEQDYFSLWYYRVPIVIAIILILILLVLWLLKKLYQKPKKPAKLQRKPTGYLPRSAYRK